MVRSITVPTESTSSHRSIVMSQGHERMYGSPSNSGDFVIEEPVSGNSGKMWLFNAGDSLGSFRSGDDSVKIQELVSEVMGDFSTSFGL